MASEASRKKNLEEARALIAKGVPFEKLESKHQTALNRVKAINRRKTVADVQKTNPDVSESDASRVAFASSDVSRKSSTVDIPRERATAMAIAGNRLKDEDTTKTSINEDDSHRAQLGTVADHLSNLIDQVEARGQSDTLHYNRAVSHLANAYEAHRAHGDAHLLGYVDEAKQKITEMSSHLTHAVEYLRSAHPDLFSGSFGVNNRSLPKIISGIKDDYVNSTEPGVGGALAPGKVARKRPTVVPVDNTNYSVTERAAMGKPIAGWSDAEFASQIRFTGAKRPQRYGTNVNRANESELENLSDSEAPKTVSNETAKALLKDRSKEMFGQDTAEQESNPFSGDESLAVRDMQVRNMMGFSSSEEGEQEAPKADIYNPKMYTKDEMRNVTVHAVSHYVRKLNADRATQKLPALTPDEQKSAVMDHPSFYKPLDYLRGEGVKPITSGLSGASRASKLNSSFRGE